MIAKIKLNDVYGDNINTRFLYLNIGNDYRVLRTSRNLIKGKYAQHFKNLRDGKLKYDGPEDNNVITNELEEVQTLAALELSCIYSKEQRELILNKLNNPKNTHSASHVIQSVGKIGTNYYSNDEIMMEEPNTNYALTSIDYFDENIGEWIQTFATFKDIYLIGNDGKTIDVLPKNAR